MDASTHPTPSPYRAPTVTIRAPYQPWTTPPKPGDGGTIVRVVLDVRTGDLYAIPSPPGDTTRRYYDPALDLWHRTHGYERTPTRIAWDARIPWRWTETSAATAAHLARIAPTAQRLLDALAPVPGTNGEWDWTPAATAAEDRIQMGVLTTPIDDDHDAYWTAPLPDRCDYGVVGFGEMLDTAPQMIDPAWATMTDAELDAVAADWCGSAGHPFHHYLPRDVATAVLDRYHRRDEHTGHHHVPVCLVGGRVDLRRWRDAEIKARTGLPATPAGEHLAGGLGAAENRLTATTSDPELEHLADQVDADAAHRARVALVGTAQYLRQHRAAMRARVRDELASVGAQWATAAAELQRIAAVRAGLLHQVVAFREPPEWPPGDSEPSYAELGRLAGMTRQSARDAVAPTLTREGAPA